MLANTWTSVEIVISHLLTNVIRLFYFFPVSYQYWFLILVHQWDDDYKIHLNCQSQFFPPIRSVWKNTETWSLQWLVSLWLLSFLLGRYSRIILWRDVIIRSAGMFKSTLTEFKSDCLHSSIVRKVQTPVFDRIVIQNAPQLQLNYFFSFFSGIRLLVEISYPIKMMNSNYKPDTFVIRLLFSNRCWLTLCGDLSRTFRKESKTSVL